MKQRHVEKIHFYQVQRRIPVRASCTQRDPIDLYDVASCYVRKLIGNLICAVEGVDKKWIKRSRQNVCCLNRL